MKALAAFLALVTSSLPAGAFAEKNPPSRPAPRQLEEITVTHNYTLGRPFAVRLTPDGSTVLFLRSGRADSKASLYAYDVATKETSLLLSAEQLLGGAEEQLSVEEKAMRERKRIKTSGFTGYAMSSDGSKIVVKLSGKVWIHDRSAGLSAQVDTPDGVVIDARLSPDAKRLAFVRNHDLYVMKLDAIPSKAPKKGPRVVGGKVVALTSGGTAEKSFGTAEFVAQEEMSRYVGYWWSPDSKSIAYQSTDVSGLEQFTIADASRPEHAANVFPYPRPGKANAVVRLYRIGVDGKNRTEITWDRAKFPYLTRVTWSKNAPLSLIVQARDQRAQVYLRVSKDDRTAPMFEEKDAAWLNITNSVPRWLPDGKSYLWATEESGRWQLERHWPKFNKKKGGLTKREVVVEGEAALLSLVHVDAKRDRVWFLAAPKAVDTLLYRAKLSKRSKPVRVSPPSGEFAATFSSDGSRFVLSRASMQDLLRSTVHEADEGPLAPLEPYKAGAPLADAELPFDAKTPKHLPRTEIVEPSEADGFWGAITRPRGFDPKKKYPVVVYVYGGPGFTVVKSNAVAYLVQQWMADHGFVVVSVDGRGTPRRGRDHERALREKFGDVPLEDQVRGLKALGARYPELDLERVGIYGWSFGGYMSALAVMRRPDIFKVGVAGAPVVDWLYYDTHYTERYLGLPDDAPKAYASSSLLTYAKDLERPLLLVHGIADDNVYFAHTLQLADHLFRAGKDFDLLPLVGLTHQIADPSIRETLYGRMANFLGQVLWK
ncbi:MAG: DPP IV N-terminal domain-containing protein [Deltaproteobacteria bacterium]|jgi:dipeptidyl-peptidase-4